MTKTKIARIPKELWNEAEQISKKTGIPKSKSLLAITRIIPEIKSAKIQKTKNGKKKLKLLTRHDFEL